MTAVERLRLERGVRHLHSLGARAVFEMLNEMAKQGGDIACVLRLLTQFEQLTPEMMRAAGGHVMPCHELRVVPGDLPRLAR